MLFISDKGYQTEKLSLINIAHLKKSGFHQHRSWSRKSSYELVKIKNWSSKLSHKLDRILIRRIGTFRSTESETEAKEPTNHNACSLAL